MTELAAHDMPPEWFDNAFIEKALRNGFDQDDLEVIEFEAKMAAAPGDHYASKLFRCHVKTKRQKDKKENGKTREISVIVKAIPTGAMGAELKKFSVFEKEAEMLSTILPKMTEILRRVYPEQETPGPECYYYEGSPNNVLVMEDLKEKEFAMADRVEGLDLDHAKLVLKGMARYHAASLVLARENPNDLMRELFTEPIWGRKNIDMIDKFVNNTLSSLLEDFPNWPNVERKDILLQKLKTFQVGALERVVDIFEADEARMNVLLHGDSWVNNFMFRYDASSGKPVDMKFVDFQLCTLNSPAIDLQYFIFSSTKEDIKFTQVDTCLKIYHQEFDATLNRLNFVPETPYGFDRLKKDFDDRSVWGLVVFCCIFPLFKVPTGETMDPDELLQADKSSFQSVFQREKLRKALAKGFLYFEEKGII